MVYTLSQDELKPVDDVRYLSCGAKRKQPDSQTESEDERRAEAPPVLGHSKSGRVSKPTQKHLNSKGLMAAYLGKEVERPNKRAKISRS